MWIERKITPRLLSLCKQFPILGILGPRQSGKTSLAKHLFPTFRYLNLEEFDTRRFATEDPRRFLKGLEGEPGVILDEVQRAPELFSYLQGFVDNRPTPGFFVLTGSENVLLNQQITQTLAGRIALTTLLPFSIDELSEAKRLPASLDAALFQGMYPPIYKEGVVDSQAWIQNYVQTYVERDVRQIKQVTDLSLFQKFLRLCAGRIGQLLDLTAVGNECGITAHTVRSWLSILEATYIVFLVQPYHKNFNKRLVKRPKLYFYDSAIACHLLGLSSAKDVETHYLRGSLFESCIFSDLMKRRWNQGLLPNAFFWRDKTGHEVDCILEEGQDLIPIEIKSGETIRSEFFSSLLKWKQLEGVPPNPGYVIYGGEEVQERSQGTVLGWTQLNRLPKSL